MKKLKNYFLAGILATTFFNLNPNHAKADYCDDALQMCYDRCDEIYEYPYLEVVCQAGCLIGYLDCINS